MVEYLTSLSPLDWHRWAPRASRSGLVCRGHRDERAKDGSIELLGDVDGSVDRLADILAMLAVASASMSARSCRWVVIGAKETFPACRRAGHAMSLPYRH